VQDSYNDMQSNSMKIYTLSHSHYLIGVFYEDTTVKPGPHKQNFVDYCSKIILQAKTPFLTPNQQHWRLLNMRKYYWLIFNYSFGSFACTN